MSKYIFIFVIIFLLIYSKLSSAIDATSISLFVSNNTNIIDVQSAYERLLSEAQDQLKNTIINTMQENHMEQSQCEDSIGMYKMKNNDIITADNSKIFTTSRYQNISDSKVFVIAKDLANLLKQESIAVFIPNKSENIGNIIVNLKSHQYHIAEILKITNEKLPEKYAEFTLHFSNKNGGLENAIVSSIEWLGNKNDPKIIHDAFPQEEIISKHGKAFLVFKNGQKEEI